MKICILFVLVSVTIVAGRFRYTAEWELWKKEHGRTYSSDEEELQRHMIWEANKNYVDKHNKHADVFGFTLAMNKFADMESGEFAKLYNGYRRSLDRERKYRELFVPSVSTKDLPETMDWRTKGYVTEVKNQGQCGSCWAFSTTGSLEGQHFNATGELVSLSEQNLMDCSKKEGNHGCEGGLMDLAFEYIIKNDGIDKEKDYKYRAHNELFCRYFKIFRGATMSSYKDIAYLSESDLLAAVGTVGPISVAIDASHSSFQLYHEGVYFESKCSETKLDHGVLAVGYGSDDGVDYWLVKNSWGADWGLEGYIKMSRNKNNNCGIATNASFPII